MANSSVFVCQQCGSEFAKWLGKCSVCNSWNSLVESVKVTGKGSKSQSGKNKTSISKPSIKLTDIKASQLQRASTGISELDRAIGGGLVNGQVLLLAGEPGIGKCVVGETIVPTDGGMMTIKSMMPKNAKLGFVPLRKGIQSVNGREFTNQFYKSGLQPTLLAILKKIKSNLILSFYE